MGKGEILSIGGSWDYGRMSERYRFASVGTGGALGTDASDRFTGIDNKLAGYVTFQQPIGGWTVMPGARVEHDRRRVTSPGHPDVDAAGTDLFPTAHIERPLSKTLDLTLSYSKRIGRSQLNDLRPYPLVQDVITIKRANPHLKDESTDAYEANLKYHRKKLDVGLIVYDRETSHLFSQSYTSVNGVSLVNIVNSGHSRDRGAEIDMSTPIVRRVKLTGSVNLFDSRMPVGDASGRSNEHRFRYTTNGTIEWDGPDRGKKPGDVAQLQWVYYGPWRQFQLHYLAWNQLSLSYTHSLSRTVSLSGTLTYNSPNRHRLFAPLVQEDFRDRGPVEFKIKLLKTFGAPH
jgi:outer membrane receptor protein involved in Fe transport